MYCNQCGAKHPEGAKYCGTCGSVMQGSSKSSGSKSRGNALSTRSDGDIALPILGWLCNTLMIVFLPILNINGTSLAISVIVLGVGAVVLGAMYVKAKTFHGTVIIMASIVLGYQFSLRQMV